MKSAAEHAELLRKVETVNTLTAANKKLGEEKNKLAAEAVDLNAKIARLEADILPIEGEEEIGFLNIQESGCKLWATRSSVRSHRSLPSLSEIEC